MQVSLVKQLQETDLFPSPSPEELEIRRANKYTDRVVEFEKTYGVSAQKLFNKLKSEGLELSSIYNDSYQEFAYEVLVDNGKVFYYTIRIVLTNYKDRGINVHCVNRKEADALTNAYKAASVAVHLGRNYEFETDSFTDYIDVKELVKNYGL